MFPLVILHDETLKEQVHVCVRETLHLHISTFCCKQSVMQQEIAQAMKHLVCACIAVIAQHIPVNRGRWYLINCLEVYHELFQLCLSL